MNKKLFVVLVVVAAMLLSISLAIGAKKSLKGLFQELKMPELAEQQAVTPVPQAELSEQLMALPLDISTEPADRVTGGVPTPPGSMGAFCDILWYCDVTTIPDDNQILGCETFRDTIYLTGGGGTNHPDVNMVYAWERQADQCVYLYGVPQPAHTNPSGWGWRDIACDGEYLYASYSSTLNCFYVTSGGVVEVSGNDITFPSLSVVRAVAWDEDRQVFWAANFSTSIYGFDRNGNTVYGPYGNTYPLYGMAYDGQWLWCHSQDDTKVYQFDPNTGQYTGVYCSGYGDPGNPAGGLCILEGDPSAKSVTALGVTQYTPNDVIYAMDILYGPPIGCCQFTGYCDMITEDDCINAGGTWYPDLQCIGDVCTTPIDTMCHLQWDNGSVTSYFPGWNVGDKQVIYYDPETMCPDCGPDVYPFQLTQVSGMFYDFASVGYVDVIFHLYEAEDDICLGPGAEIASFPATITTFYPSEAFVSVPGVLCLDQDFFLGVEYNSGTTGSIPCLLMDSQQEMADTCVMFNWYDGAGWYEWWTFWAPPIPGYLMFRADGVCNSGACVEAVPCDLVQDQGAAAWLFGSFAEGDAIAKYFDPEVYCEEPVYPYKIHDVEFMLYDFAGTGTADIIIDVHIVCHDSCDGPGTRIYESDPITVTTFYPDWIHLDLPEQVCVWEPFFISLEYASGVQGSTPSFLFDDDVFPCDTCHAWVWWESGGASPPWWEWYDFWAPPIPGCPLVRVTGFTEHPDCVAQPCDTTLVTLWGGEYAAYYWEQPANMPFLNMQFEMPVTNDGRLDEIEIAWYAPGTVGSPDPDIYVWLSDGTYPLDNNPPYQSIAEFHLTYGQIVWYPSYTVIQTWDRLIEFDAGEKFHIGGSHAFDPGDILAWLSDDGEGGCDDRASGWDGTAWSSYSPYGFLINAVICPYPAEESTFTMKCSPSLAYATPGDPPMDLYTVDVGSVLGYNLVVDLTCSPPAGITVGFNPNNLPPPYTSNVSVSVAVGTDYGDYTLTFKGTGADGQVKTCDVTLEVQAPFDECLVDFYHGKQRATNFGAVGDHDNPAQSFLWYGITDLLFDGTFIVATDVDSMALDMARTHHHVGWLPSRHIDCYYDSTCPTFNVGYAEFFTPETVISCEYDSLFIVGIMDSCVDFSVKIKIYYNPTPTPIEDMYIAMWEDWDLGDAYNNWGDMDTLHNLIWMYDPIEPNMVCGLFKVPFYGEPMHTMKLVPNAYYLWPEQGYGIVPESLWYLLTEPGYWEAQQVGADSQDFSVFICPGAIDLYQGDKHIEIWIDFCRDLSKDGLTWSQWWHRVLRYVGFYRGDVNASDTLEVPAMDVSDLVYLIQYLFQNGPTPIPCKDQGNVNCDGHVDIADIVYLLNYIFVDGPPPIDYPRFIPQKWGRPSLFADSLWR